MLEHEVLDILALYGTVITNDHFVYASTKHGSAYINKDTIFPHTQALSTLCEAIAMNFADHFDGNIDIVLGPTNGGALMAQWTADHLSRFSGKEVLAIFAEETLDKERIIKRGYEKLLAGARVLVVEDILNTGATALKTIATARAHGAEVIGLGAICNRGGVTEESLGNIPRLSSLVSIKLDAWDAADCHLCKAGVPVNTSVGKGREFLEKKKA